jgi:hypothetical protein
MPMRSTLFGLCLAAAGFACNGDVKDYCEKMIECEGGNDADQDACVEGIDGAQEVAAAYDCADQFDAMFQCEMESSSCQDNGNGGKNFTSTDSAGNDPCDDEEAAYGTCVQAASNLDEEG